MIATRFRPPIALLGLVTAGLLAVACEPGDRPDQLAAEIERWSAFIAADSSGDPLLVDVKQGLGPAIETSAQALRQGRRWLALERLLAVRGDLAAAAHVGARTAAERTEQAAFEAEWARMGEALAADLGAPDPALLEGVTPAVVRALGEVALPQVRVLYEASLDYGRNTMAESGWYYLEAARAQRETPGLVRGLATPARWWLPSRSDPAPRSPAPELDALEAELLALYQPPVAIDRHREFITASATLKEARELDVAGLRYGAQLRTLQAARRVAALRAAARGAQAVDGLRARMPELRTAIAGFAERLADEGGDSSVGELFVEIAEANIEQATADPAVAPDAAAAIAEGVLPVYAQLRGPAPPDPPRLAPQATVTLVRWPYT